MFYDNALFPFTETLEQNWEAIRDEYYGLKEHQLQNWFEEDLYEGDWKVFGLFAWPSGMKVSGADSCPLTTSLIEQNIPTHATAGFSILKPKTEIKPHVGYQGNFLRCHLGLIVPTHCGINVNGDTREWEEGEVVVFDDTYEHFAWNKSDLERVVLLIDFTKPSELSS